MKNINILTAVVLLVGLFSQSAYSVTLCRQYYRESLKEIMYLMNTQDLLSYVERGNPARSGIPKVWSSKPILSEVLSLRGPLGPWGPASELGPIGDNPWNPSFWWSNFLVRSSMKMFSDKLIAKVGPLSKKGSLGSRGPLAKDWGEGAYSILGTTGILGPLGPLGALGLMGALQTRGLKGPDANGNYYYGGRVVKSIDIEWPDGKHEFEILEKYSDKEVNRRSANGSLENSYMVDASLAYSESSKSYRSKSDREKVVSVLVIPDISTVAVPFGFNLSNFDIEVRDKGGKLIGKSASVTHANFLQFAVPKNGEYDVTVRRQGFSWLPLGYRLISVGVDAEYFETFPNVSASNTLIDLNIQIEDYLKRLSEQSVDIKVRR